MKKRILIVGLVILIIFAIIIICKNSRKTQNINANLLSTEFEVTKTHFYSSAIVTNNTDNYQSPEWNLKINGYTDIAIYLDRINEVSNSNYIKQLYINNISFKGPAKRKS